MSFRFTAYNENLINMAEFADIIGSYKIVI